MRTPRDHPRSRGVYSERSGAAGTSLGSSPLARGLLGLAELGEGAAGIIPARAGFTPRWSPGRSSTADHPRSRGVYFTYGMTPAFSSGSSPLARGLLAEPAASTVTVGIIPARAGFTSGRSGESYSFPDHPRSRGVYSPADPPPYQPAGSSPLARGLPGELLKTAGKLRIIPARAGFTAARRSFSGEDADHPRSRGVYALASEPSELENGSSPLARGLQGVSALVLIDLRIIPARAGFT